MFALLVALGGCAEGLPAEPATLPSGGAAALATLRVAPAHSMAGYSRKKFPHWITVSDNCTAREWVLRRDGRDVTTGTDCYPTGGRWYSVYEPRWIDDPSEVDIDHVVPLANAWRSGAHAWTTARRQAFANDVKGPALIAVSAASNRAKGDQSPDQWKPANAAYWCAYAQRWIAVKAEWKLSVTAAEKEALRAMMGRCR